MDPRPRKALENTLDISSAPTRVRPNCIFNGVSEKSVSMTVIWYFGEYHFYRKHQNLGRYSWAFCYQYSKDTKVLQIKYKGLFPQVFTCFTSQRKVV